MYRMLYNDSFLFDPFDETRIVSSASITTNVNAASYLDFTIAATHPLYNTIEQRSGTITLYSDNEKLFQGQITSIDMDMDGYKSVTCSSALDWLKDVQLRPYSTDQAECDEYEFKLDKAPDALDAYFQWLIDQYNAQNKDGRYFTINVNQAADLTRQSIVYFASTSPRSVADAIEDDILKTFGGYLVLRYEDDQLILDLYSDIHEMNEQVIDYGENILDISRNESTDDQYTAVYPIGATPQYTAEQQQYHDEKDAYDEYMKQREATEKAAIENLKKEEEAEQAEIDKLKEAERAEQNRINGITDKVAKKAAREALKKRKEQRQARENSLKKRKEQRQAREQAFSDETKRLQDAQKIKDDENAADKTKPNPITIESLDNGGYPGDLDIFKEGDVVYSVSHVARYGYKEFVYSENDVHDKTELLVLAVAKLKTLMAPTLTIDVRAVDQALYSPKHRHLFAGQAVRVRSKAHNVDEFMMVSSIDLDLIDPSQTTATLGVAYDTLTGQQSSFLRNLNSQIVASVDAVDKLGEDVKVTEITLGKVETVVENTNNKADLIINTVDDYKWMTDTAWGKADDAQESADDAQESADEANQGVTDTNVRIDNIKMATDERIDGMETDISGIHTEIDNTKAEVEQAKQTAEQIRQEAQTGIQEAKDKAEDVRTEANTAIDGVKTDLAATEAKAELARQNASSALGGLSSAQAQINGLRIDVNRHQENITNIDDEIVGVKDTISGVAETANSALTVATTNTNAINEQSTRIDTAYSDIEATRTSVSEVKQTADGLKVNLETNYLDKDALGANYASKAELNATSESITSTVEKTYATKSALEGLQNIADAAIETWSGRAVPTASNPPASTWTTDALKRQHSGDIYYDMDTGKSYRWGSEDGTTYSWSMIADNDITKAIADAAKAQQTADGAKQDVVNLSNDVEATYTSKSEFEQTSDEIRASVNEVASANETNAQNIAEVSVKADGISAKVEEQAETIDGHTTTIGQLSVKADGLQTKFEQVSTSLDVALANSEELLYNGGFEFGMDGWSCSYAGLIMTSNVAHSGMKWARTLMHAKELISTKPIKAIKGRRYRFGVWYKIGNGYTNNYGGLRIQKSTDGTNFSDWKNKDITMEHTADGDWRYVYVDGIADDTVRFMRARIAFRNTIDIFLDDLSIKDITDAYDNAEKADAALTKSSQLEQTLDGFRQTVSETYTTKDEFNNLTIGGRNLLKDTKTPKQITGTNTTNQGGNIYELVPNSWARLEAGQYVLSVDVKYEGVISGAIAFQRDNSPWGFTPAAKIDCTKSFSDAKRSAHFEFLIDNAYDGASRKLAARLDNVQGTVTFSNVKLERGTKATAWSPAPEDMLDVATASTTYTTKSEFTQTANEIKGTVAEQATTIDGHANSIASLSLKATKFETDISQTSEQVNGILDRTSTLEQDLNGFRQTVSETYTTKIETEDAINAMQIGGTNLSIANGYYNVSGLKNFTYTQADDQYDFDVSAASSSGWGHSMAPKNACTEHRRYPWGKWGTCTFDIYAERECTFVTDINNKNADGSSSGNDNDLRSKAQKILPDGSVQPLPNNSSTATHITIPAQQWVRIGIMCYNGSESANPNHADIQDYSSIGFLSIGEDFHVKVRKIKFEVGNKPTAWSPCPLDMLDKASAETNYATKSLVEQTESRITSTVEQTYATKTQLSDEMKQSLKTFELRGRMDGNYWLKMGRVTMAQQGKDFHIDYTGGRGFNGSTSQNSQLEIHVRSGNGWGTLFAVTLNRLLNADMYTVKAFAIDATHIDLYMKSGAQYSTGTIAYYGQYTDFSGAKQIDDISTAEGTELTVLEQSLSTKSYVDQTAESVSIGVVEDFKDGKHGDKLTTQSNLTALKDEINISVSEQYADLSDQIKLANSDNAVGKNFSFESNNFEGWASHDNWTIDTNGAHTGRYYAQNTIPAHSNGNQLISRGSIAAEYGHTYKLEYWVKKKPNTQCRGIHRISYKRSGVWEDLPSDYGTTIFLDDEGKTNINVGAGGGYFDVTDSWMKVTTYIIPPSNVTDIRVRIIGYNPGSAETVYAVDDVSLTDYSVAKTINTTMSQIDQKADSISQTVTNNYASLNAAIGAVGKRITGLENSNFDAIEEGSDRLTGWTANGPWTRANLSGYSPVQAGSGTYFTGTTSGVADQTISLINDGYITTYPGMKLQISLWAWIDDNAINNNAISIGVIQQNNAITRESVTAETNSWKQYSATVTIPNNVDRVRVRIAFTTTARSAAIRLDSVSVADVTTANVALGKATTVETNLEHYKTTVSNTYADKNTVEQMQTQWTQTAQGFEAAITANSYSVSVINSGFESGDLSGWEPWGFIPAEVTNASLNYNNTYYFKGVTDSSNYHGLKNTGTMVARKNDQIKVSARILVLDSSGNPVTATVSIGYQALYNQVPYTEDVTTTTTGWSVVSSTGNVPGDTLCSAWIDIKNLRNGYTVCIDDVEMLNVTEAVILRNDLETRIAMTSRGVRVGKVEDGTFKGMSALVNSEGSFDILNGEQVQATMSDSNVGLMRDNTTGRYRFQIKPYSQDGKNGTNLLSYGQVSLNSMPTVPATTSVNCMLPSGTATVNSGSSYIMPWDYSYFETNDLFIPYPQEYRTNYYQTISDGAILDDKAYKHAVGILGYDEEDRQSLVFLNPGLYAVQYNAHVLHTSNAYFDYCLRFKTPGSTSWVSIPGAPDWRAIEVGDPAGYLQRTSIVAWVNVDVGTMMQLHVKSSVNGQKLSIANHIHITRMPFGCAIMNQ